MRLFSFYSIQLLSWLPLFGARIALSWFPLSRVSALYWYYKIYGLVYVIAAVVYWSTMILLFYYVLFETVIEFFFPQISNLFICGIFEYNFFAADKEIYTFNFWSLTTSKSTKFMFSNQATTERWGFIRGQPIVVREIVTLI